MSRDAQSNQRQKMAFGLIVGNRGFFPGHLAESGREEMLRGLEQAGIDVVALGIDESKYGSVETHDEAKRCAALFRKHADRIDGVIVSLPTFGDERAIADTLRLARLEVPVLVQATPDDALKMTILHRRDSFCGKMSACNNLRQYGIPYSLTKLHTVGLDTEDFQNDLAWFAAVCRAANRIQYRPLQREVAGSAQDLYRNSRSVRSVWPHSKVEG